MYLCKKLVLCLFVFFIGISMAPLSYASSLDSSLGCAVDNTFLAWATDGNHHGGAPSFVLEEGFEQDFPPVNWTNNGWQKDLYGSPCEGSHWAYSWAIGDTLTTPSLYFGPDYTTLTFQHKVESSAHPMDLEIYLDYQTPDEMLVWSYYEATYESCEVKVVNLPAYDSEHSISFVGKTSDFYGQILDDIRFETQSSVPPMDFTWSNQSEEWWFDGDAAESGMINGNAESWIQTNVTGPGTLMFNWKVSSEQDHDFLRFFIDDTEMDCISGEVDWQQTSLVFSISEGVHILNWSYETDGNWNTNGSNRGWLDKVEWYPEINDVNQSVFDRGFPIRHAVDGDWAGAQNFTPSKTFISKAGIFLRKFGAPEFDLTVELRSNGSEGTLLDTVTFTPSEIPTSWQWVEVDFVDTNVGIGSDCFIVCPPAPSGVTTSFGYEWGYAFGNQYDDGSFWFTRDGGGLWRDLPMMYEMTFRTYGHG